MKYLSMGFAPESGLFEPTAEQQRPLDGQRPTAVIRIEESGSTWYVRLVHRNHSWTEEYSPQGPRPQSVTDAVGKFEQQWLAAQ